MCVPVCVPVCACLCVRAVCARLQIFVSFLLDGIKWQVGAAARPLTRRNDTCTLPPRPSFIAWPVRGADVGFNRVVEGSEIAFTAIFTLEMVLKILAMGFYFSKYAYLRDPWNVLDFAVVMLGYAALIPGFGAWRGVQFCVVFVTRVCPSTPPPCSTSLLSLPLFFPSQLVLSIPLTPVPLLLPHCFFFLFVIPLFLVFSCDRRRRALTQATTRAFEPFESFGRCGRCRRSRCGWRCLQLM